MARCISDLNPKRILDMAWWPGDRLLAPHNEGLGHQMKSFNLEPTYYLDGGCATYLGDGSYKTQGGISPYACFHLFPRLYRVLSLCLACCLYRSPI